MMWMNIAKRIIIENQAIKFLKGYCKQQKIWEDMTEED